MAVIAAVLTGMIVVAWRARVRAAEAGKRLLVAVLWVTIAAATVVELVMMFGIVAAGGLAAAIGAAIVAAVIVVAWRARVRAAEAGKRLLVIALWVAIAVAAVVEIGMVLSVLSAEPAQQAEPAAEPVQPVPAAEPVQPVPVLPRVVVAPDDFATEGEACRSMTDAEWIEDSDALEVVHVEATEPDGLIALCQYTEDGGELLKVHLSESNTTATPSDRFMEATAYVIALFADDAGPWVASAVATRTQWGDGVMMRILSRAGQSVSVRNADGVWKVSITRAAPVPSVAKSATEGEACRSVTDADWVENPDELRLHRKGSAIHVEATEPGGLMALCRYTTEGGELLMVLLVEFTTADAPSDRFMEAAAYVIALFADSAAGWFEHQVKTRGKWPDGVAIRNHEMWTQTVSVANVTGVWEMNITRDADYALQD